MALLLEHEWKAWFDHSTPGRSAKDYEKGLFPICTVKTVEDFWGCFNNLPSVSTLDSRSGYHFMILGVKPAWEDEKNVNGGTWKIRVNKSEAEEVWKELLMSLIGDTYKDEIKNQVNGVSISCKQSEFVFTLWFKEDSQTVQIRKYLNNLLPQVKLVADPSYSSCKNLVTSLTG